MKSNTSNVANGAATLTQSTNGKNGVKVETKTADTPKTEAPKISGTTKTVEEQRERSHRLVDLFDKENKLIESRDTLKSFRLASDENTNELYLKDGKGTQFRTCNAVVIGEVLDVIKKTIDAKLTEVQVQIVAA
jgi:hypothetical protein